MYDRIAAEIRNCPIYEAYETLCEKAIDVVRAWSVRFSSRPDIWARFVKNKDQNLTRVVKEFIEAAPVIYRVLNNVENDTSGDKLTVIDLCSGFGFLSMFLSELLPADRVSRIVLIDNRWSSAALQRDIELDRAAKAETENMISVEHNYIGPIALSAIEKAAAAVEDIDMAKYISCDHITGACPPKFTPSMLPVTRLIFLF